MKKNYQEPAIIFLIAIFTFTSINNVLAQGALTLPSGASITTVGTSTITLNNAKLNNGGTFTDAAGTLLYTGDATASNSTIEGAGTTNLNHVTINKSSNNVQLNKNIAVKGNLTLSAGGIVLNNGTIDLGTTGKLQNENETNHISGTGGTIQAKADLNAPTAANPGSLGAVITSTSNLGNTTIVRSHAGQTAEGSSILRNYTITPTNNTGLDATLVFNYLDAELNSNVETNFVLWQSTDNGNTWTATTSTLDATNNTITLTGIDSFGNYTADTPSTLDVATIESVDTFSLYNEQEEIHLNSSLSIQKIHIYDLTGKCMYQENNINQNNHSIQLNNISTQVLIINTQFTNGKQLSKKIIF
jgi:hypothetical protein